MIQLTHPFRRATPVTPRRWPSSSKLASEGLALYLWTKFAGPGGDPWAVGRERALRETGAFSFFAMPLSSSVTAARPPA